VTLPAGPGLLLMAGLACLALGALCLLLAVASAIHDHRHPEHR
jgi:hypothetical protein